MWLFAFYGILKLSHLIAEHGAGFDFILVSPDSYRDQNQPL
jgi:hypothetical protein